MRKLTLITCFLLVASVFSQNNKLLFKPTVTVGGRIMYDYEFLKAGDYSLNGNEFRRLRLHTKGNVSKNIKYKVEFDFAGGSPAFRDVYLQFKLPKNIGSLKTGSFTEPSSLNNMISSNSITFFERAMLTNTQPFKYNAGFLFENFNIFNTGATFQLAQTFNGDKNSGFIDTNIEDGVNYIARITKTLINDKSTNKLLHLGINYENRKNNSNTYEYKFRFENHMGDKYTVTGIGDFKNTSDIGFELATNYKNFSFQSEFENAAIITDVDTYKVKAYYAFASYFITGERRPYKNGVFKGINPNKSIDNGGVGAVELALRYSVMDFNDYPGITANNKIDNITLGLNVYLNKYTRFMYNYTLTGFNDLAIYDNEKLSSHLFRFQVFF